MLGIFGRYVTVSPGFIYIYMGIYGPGKRGFARRPLRLFETSVADPVSDRPSRKTGYGSGFDLISIFYFYKKADLIEILWGWIKTFWRIRVINPGSGGVKQLKE